MFSKSSVLSLARSIMSAGVLVYGPAASCLLTVYSISSGSVTSAVSAFQVASSRRPLAFWPFELWNAATMRRMLGPKLPSISPPGNQAWSSSICARNTASPRAPCASAGVAVLPLTRSISAALDNVVFAAGWLPFCEAVAAMATLAGNAAPAASQPSSCLRAIGVWCCINVFMGIPARGAGSVQKAAALAAPLHIAVPL